MLSTYSKKTSGLGFNTGFMASIVSDIIFSKDQKCLTVIISNQLKHGIIVISMLNSYSQVYDIYCTVLYFQLFLVYFNSIPRSNDPNFAFPFLYSLIHDLL